MSSERENAEHLSLREAARRIGVHENTIRNWVARGLLESEKVAGSRYPRFSADDVDRVAHQQQVSSEKARRTEGTSELVDADYLDSWAGSREAEELLPEVVARLIEGTTGVVGVHMRTGDGIRLQGWDGLVEDSPGSPWVPTGPSAWELGTGGDPRRKADADFTSRTAKPLEVEPSVTSFMFVTPRRWPGARKWEQARRAEGPWRSVGVLDADDLAGWLRSQPATHLWFSEAVGLQPLEVRPLNQWWDRFRRQIEPPIPPELLLAGRDEAAKSLLDRLQGPTPPPIFVRAASRDEATAFIAAAFEISTDPPKYDALIATSPHGWERLSLGSQPAVLIPHIDEPQTATAVGMGHRVIVPLAAGTTPFRGDVIELGRLDRNVARDVLVQKTPCGLVEADRLAGLARRSFASFLRAPELAAMPRSSPAWARGDQARLFAALVLVGSWAPTEADRQAVSQIAGKDWESIEDALVAVSDLSDPLFVPMGAGWQVVSADGAWMLLRNAAQTIDIERFCDKAVEILGEPDPALTLDPEERLQAHLRGIRRRFSPALSQGVAQGLALLGAFNDQFSDPTYRQDDGEYTKPAVRRLLRRANDDTSGLHWRSISPYLQLLAEAAPDALLDAVEGGLAGDEPVLRTMFVDEKQSAVPGALSEHTGLLWALELLCWSPRHLSGAAAALARLAEIDPGGRPGSRPHDSLRTVFLPWLPQTSAPLRSRLEVLDGLRARFPDVAWQLEMAIMPSDHGKSLPTPRPRFRQWPTTDERPPLSEWLEAITEITGRAIEDANTSPLRWADFVMHTTGLPTDERGRVIAALGDLSPDDMEDEPRTKLWQSLVGHIAKHRQYSDARWALSEKVLQALETTAERLKPDDLVARYAPFFDWDPPLPHVSRRDPDEHVRAIAAVRGDAVRQILRHLGFSGIESLARASNLPEHVGFSTAEVAPGEHFSEVRNLFSRIDKLRRLAHGWVDKMAADAKWVDARNAELSGWSIATQIGFLLALRTLSARTVDAIDSLDTAVQRQYWETVRPINVDDDAVATVVNRLLPRDRPWVAIDVLGLACCRPNRGVAGAVSPEQVIKVLDHALASDSLEPGAASRAAFEISQLLDYLEVSGVPAATLARLEWSYFRVLENTRQPRALYKALSNDPELFVELVCRVYRPKRVSSSAKEDGDAGIAQNAWSVLNEWRPRLSEPGAVDINNLRSWVEQVRTELASRDRADIGDHQIGQTLSGPSLGADGIWPTEKVRRLIEDLASTNLESGLVTGVFNSRGVLTRGVYEGGTQEWALAAQYRRWGEAVINRWRRTGRVLMHLADGYEREARREDLEAHTRASDV
jgi:excisionase family DNA binding protein